MSEPTSATEEFDEQARDIKRSAHAVERSMGQFADSADRRTALSGDRTLLAAERTYAAWVRTALAALASGVGATAVMKDVLPSALAKLTGSVLVIFAGFCLIAAVWRELNGVSRVTHPDIRPIPTILLLPLNFFLLLVAAAALVGIWSA
jgi:putative membrane protein